jgi:hypothetical protein
MASPKANPGYPELFEVYKRLNEQYEVALAAAIQAALGHDLLKCKGCKRYQIPARTWKRFGLRYRQDLRGFVRAGAKGFCNTCYGRKVKDGTLKTDPNWPTSPRRMEIIPTPLSPEVVEHLRAVVGVNIDAHA